MLPDKDIDLAGARSGFRKGLLLWGVGLLLELLAIQTVPTGIGLSVAVHTAACALLARGLHGMMPPSQQSPRRAGLLFLFAVTFSMPLLGALGMLGGLLAERYFPSPLPPPPRFNRVGFPELPPEPLEVAARPDYGDGALSATLMYSPNSERRLAAVLAARQLRDRSETEVLRLALTDKVDDVRLLAYSILDHKEQAMNVKLKALLDELQDKELTQAKRASLKKRIAQIHFELIDLGLARGEVQAYLLAEARKHIDDALRVDPQDRESLFLLGCVTLHQGELEVAERSFLKAQVLGMALEKVLPFLAELAFQQRRYDMVTYYLRAITPLYFRTQPLLSGIAAHWLPEEKPQCSPR